MTKLFNSVFHTAVIFVFVLSTLVSAVPFDSIKRTRNEYEDIYLNEVERISSEPVPTALPTTPIANMKTDEKETTEPLQNSEEQLKLVPSPTTNQMGITPEVEISTSPSPIVQSADLPAQTPEPTPILEQFQVNGPHFCPQGKRNCLRRWRCDINVYRRRRRNRRRWSYWNFCRRRCRIKAGICF